MSDMLGELGGDDQVDGLIIEVPERRRCTICRSTKGTIRVTGGQNTVRCDGCGRFLFNAPKTLTGQRTRSVSTARAGITPKTRAEVIIRARGRCELCGTDLGDVPAWHVEHLLDVAIAVAEGLPDELINSGLNLAAFCEECNLGRKNLIDPVIWLVLLRRRLAG